MLFWRKEGASGGRQKANALRKKKKTSTSANRESHAVSGYENWLPSAQINKAMRFVSYEQRERKKPPGVAGFERRSLCHLRGGMPSCYFPPQSARYKERRGRDSVIVMGNPAHRPDTSRIRHRSSVHPCKIQMGGGGEKKIRDFHLGMRKRERGSRGSEQDSRAGSESTNKPSAVRGLIGTGERFCQTAGRNSAVYQGKKRRGYYGAKVQKGGSRICVKLTVRKRREGGKETYRLSGEKRTAGKRTAASQENPGEPVVLSLLELHRGHRHELPTGPSGERRTGEWRWRSEGVIAVKSGRNMGVFEWFEGGLKQPIARREKGRQTKHRGRALIDSKGQTAFFSQTKGGTSGWRTRREGGNSITRSRKTKEGYSAARPGVKKVLLDTTR